MMQYNGVLFVIVVMGMVFEVCIVCGDGVEVVFVVWVDWFECVFVDVIVYGCVGIVSFGMVGGFVFDFVFGVFVIVNVIDGLFGCVEIDVGWSVWFVVVL